MRPRRQQEPPQARQLDRDRSLIVDGVYLDGKPHERAGPAEDEATPRARRDRWPEIRELVGGWLSTFSTVEDAVEALTAARVPSAPVLSPPEVIEHPHLRARDFFAAVPHPGRGSVRVTATPFHVDGRPPGPAGPAPYRVGEHTRAVLAELAGYAAPRIDALVAEGVVGAP